jgi:hypothetical protein
VVVNGDDLVVILKRHDAPSHLTIARNFLTERLVF